MLSPDVGESFIDQNAARNPNSPLEPLFRSLFALKPNFDMSNIDLVSDRNNIRKLLRFVTSSSKDTFEIKVEIVGNGTTLFTRVSPNSTTMARGNMGYGHNFENAITKDHVGTGHHRIVSYQLGGMMMINRHEVDGYLDEKYDQFGEIDFTLPTGFSAAAGPAIREPVGTIQAGESTADGEMPVIEKTTAALVKKTSGALTAIISNQSNTSPPGKAQALETENTISTLLSSLTITDRVKLRNVNLPTATPLNPKSAPFIPPHLRGLQGQPPTATPLNPKSAPNKTSAQRGVKIQSLGTHFPTSQTLEIKTRPGHKPLIMRDILPQLWLSQTPHLVVGYHHSEGLFDRIEVTNMVSAVHEWEEENQENLGRLVGLIRWIIEKVKGIEGRRGTVRFEGGNVIKIMGLEDENVAMGQSPFVSKSALKRGEKMRKMMHRRALPDDLYEKWNRMREDADEDNDEFGDGEAVGGGVKLS
jgi:hypothetical protein